LEHTHPQKELVGDKCLLLQQIIKEEVVVAQAQTVRLLLHHQTRELLVALA
jgi:hypothetical protein